ncbi:hypothetical protein, partial [Jatrophihabitans sp.]|uniref:hypothetical protein n=1 Tax=Jatrophihabitans sp. TaxID=1932789 RepID=UPI0030C7392C|nr:hypothetical protein [Jatrophihabitans sp.]
MSDTPDDKPISLSKSGAGEASKPAIDRPSLPQSMQLAFAAMAALIVLTVVSALALLGSSTTLQHYLITQNAKAKKPKKGYTFGSHDVLKDLHTLRVSSVVLAAVLTFILIGIFFAFRNVRRASAARWLLLVALIITSSVFRVVPIKGYPAFAKDTGVAAGVAAIILLVAVFMPSSANYFKNCREAALPPEQRGLPAAARPRLFGPR